MVKTILCPVGYRVSILIFNIFFQVYIDYWVSWGLYIRFFLFWDDSSLTYLSQNWPGKASPHAQLNWPMTKKNYFCELWWPYSKILKKNSIFTFPPIVKTIFCPVGYRVSILIFNIFFFRLHCVLGIMGPKYKIFFVWRRLESDLFESKVTGPSFAPCPA